MEIAIFKLSFYPNNTPGSGFITMKISDSVTTKFVSWYGLATTASTLVELNQLNKPSLLKITDLLGRETEPVKGELFLHSFIEHLKNGGGVIFAILS